MTPATHQTCLSSSIGGALPLHTEVRVPREYKVEIVPDNSLHFRYPGRTDLRSGHGKEEVARLIRALGFQFTVWGYSSVD